MRILKIQQIKENGHFLQKWNDFVYNHPNGTIFHTPHYFNLHHKRKHSDSIGIALIDNSDEISAILLPVIHKNSFWGKLSARAIIHGGPLIKDHDRSNIKSMFNTIDLILRKKVVYSQYRNLTDMSTLHPYFLEMGYIYEDHLDIIVDLSKSVEILWKEVHTKRKNEIRRAEREGTTVELLCHRNMIDSTYPILKEVYIRAKLPLPPKEYFEAAYIELGKHFKVFVAKNMNNIIGTMYTLCYKDTIYDWYAGSFKQFYNKYPNDLIPWRVFLWGKENGYKSFIFGGAGKPGVPYGVREYKKKFGGEFVNCGRYSKAHKTILFDIAKYAFKVYRLVKV